MSKPVAEQIADIMLQLRAPTGMVPQFDENGKKYAVSEFVAVDPQTVVHAEKKLIKLFEQFGSDVIGKNHPTNGEDDDRAYANGIKTAQRIRAKYLIWGEELHED